MPKRRANGEGNIRKRKDGRWEGRYTAGYDPETGKRIIKNVLGKTQAEVKEKLKAAISESQRLDVSKAGKRDFEEASLPEYIAPEQVERSGAVWCIDTGYCFEDTDDFSQTVELYGLWSREHSVGIKRLCKSAEDLE